MGKLVDSLSIVPTFTASFILTSQANTAPTGQVAAITHRKSGFTPILSALLLTAHKRLGE